ncbi:inositol-trisphosphate 3-kinase B-like [Oncorhynchus clarkii lewisi]|uniref:inositol-trisphosphate 3-kinase B-like n=1 Tax=Oncorhynchus clarkii lewisi TaxID=490388 RepID=UPI0039B84416
MDNTTPPALEEMKDVGKEKETVEGELGNGEHDDDNEDGFIGLLKDVDQHLPTADRTPSVFSGVKPQTKLLSSPDSPSNSLELQEHDGGPRMLMHSSVSSSASSFNCSSAESDEVFSEGEDTASKRSTMRRCRSWRTFLTMMQWSVRRQSSWVQLAGHQGNFQLSEGGEVLKRFSEVEAVCLQALMADPLRPFVPQYHGSVNRGGNSYIRLEDLLSGLKNPVIMDCKMGVRTYQEEELTKSQTKPTLRTDMYQKMVKVDPTALTVEEHEQRGVTKWRYLQWRDNTSSTSTLGFRIEGIMMENGSVQRDFKMLTPAQVTEALLSFTKSHLHILKAYHSRLQALDEALKESPFFKAHEVIGSSLLFVHDWTSKASIWMIDFGKTIPSPSTVQLRHDVPWAEGNREDGYLIGLAALTSLVGQAISQAACRQEEKHGEELGSVAHTLQEKEHTQTKSQGGQGEAAQNEDTSD